MSLKSNQDCDINSAYSHFLLSLISQTVKKSTNDKTLDENTCNNKVTILDSKSPLFGSSLITFGFIMLYQQLQSPISRFSPKSALSP